MENPSQELRPGRLFIHGRLNDPITGGPLYCRIRAFEAGRVEFETIYHREDGSERIGKPSRLPLDGFLELSFGRWYEGSSPLPAAPTRPRGSRCRWTRGRSGANQPTPDGAVEVPWGHQGQAEQLLPISLGEDSIFQIRR